MARNRNPYRRYPGAGILPPMLLIVLLLLSPSNLCHRDRSSRILWGTSAMSLPTDALATGALLRRNVLSGAAIFTVGDIAAQMLVLSRKRKNRSLSIETMDHQTRTEFSSTQSLSGERTNYSSLRKEIVPERTVSELRKRIHHCAQNTLRNLDTNRLYSATILGAIWSGFCVPFVYGSVENRFPGKATFQQILVKMLVTCSILSTIGNYITMYSRRLAAQCLARMNANDNEEKTSKIGILAAAVLDCWKTCNQDIGEVIVDDLKIWPLYDLACYGLIPPTWRPITTSIMSSGWAMYMSMVSAKEEEESSHEERMIVPHEDRIAPTVIVTPVEDFASSFRDDEELSSTKSETTKKLIAVAGGTSSKVPNPPFANTTFAGENVEEITEESEGNKDIPKKGQQK